MPLIRSEQQSDRESISNLIERAFNRTNEANLVDALRSGGKLVASIVAVEDGRVCGHVAFSSAIVSGTNHLIAGLAPLAVDPAYERRGIGSMLVRAGLKECSGLGYAAVIVLGDPAFYSRCGFQPASRYGLSSEYPEAGEHFMAVELQPAALEQCAGLAKYADEFREFC